MAQYPHPLPGWSAAASVSALSDATRIAEVEQPLIPNKFMWVNAHSYDSCSDGHVRFMVFANATEYTNAGEDDLVRVRRLSSNTTYLVLKKCLMEPAEMDNVEPVQAHTFRDLFFDSGAVRMCQVQGFLGNGDALVCYMAGGNVKQDCVRPTLLAACQTSIDDDTRRAMTARIRQCLTHAQHLLNMGAHAEDPAKKTRALVVRGTDEQLANAERLLRSIGMRIDDLE